MRVILSYGMGVESTVILHRWLTDPASRDFNLSDLVVLTAQVGDEFPDTKYLVETHMLPLMRQAGVRFVQVARAENKSKALAVLEDTNSPKIVHIKGKYRLSEELLTAGTVPQYAKNKRRCSLKAKGDPLDTWTTQEMKGERFHHVLGFNAEEQVRVDRDQSYSKIKRKSEYPLLDWEMGRKDCEDYLKDAFGEPWQKSCCTFCPFAAGREPIRLRYRALPEAAAYALFLEHVSLCMNPRMTLYSTGSLLEVLTEDGNEEAIGRFSRMLDQSEYAVYHIRRRFTSKTMANRALIPVARGTRAEMEKEIYKWGNPTVDQWGFLRAVIIPLDKSSFPALEELYVVGPAVVPPKFGKNFEKNWEAATRGRAPVLSGYELGVDDEDTYEDEERLEQMDWECDMADILPGP